MKLPAAEEKFVAEAIVRIEELAGGRAKRLKRAVIMHGTSRYREESARLLAKIVQESGASGAAFGWTDDLGPDVLTPVHAVTAIPHVRWDVRLSRTLARLIDHDGKFSWRLMVRGCDEARLSRAGPLLSLAAGWFAHAGYRDSPKVHSSVADGRCGRFIGLLDAYRFVSFKIGKASDLPFFQAVFRSEIDDLPDGAQEHAEAVVEALGQHDCLSGTLLDLGAALGMEGAIAEAASVHIIGYELALQRSDAATGIDAARSAGRAYRSLAEWDASSCWYGLARRIAEFEEDWPRLALALDGIGNTHRNRGSFPAARRCYEEAWRVAVMSGDPQALGNVSHSMMTVEREAGRLGSAAHYAWTAVQAQPDPAERANLLLNIGTLLREGGDLGSARCAYEVARAYSMDSVIRMMAADALAYCEALGGGDGYRTWHEVARRESRGVAPYLRAQVGYFRGRSLLALGREADAARVLRAVARYARSFGLAEWEVKAAELATKPLPQPVEAMDTPVELRQGLRELREAVV